MEAHDFRCGTCPAGGGCVYRDACGKVGAKSKKHEKPGPEDSSTKSLRIDNAKCILCGRCIRACETFSVKALQFSNRGWKMQIEPTGGVTLAESPCIQCGLCRLYCPVGALTEVPVKAGKEKKLQIDVAALASMADEIELRKAKPTPGKIIAAAKAKGYSVQVGEQAALDYVKASAKELLEHKSSAGGKPLYSIRCPAFANFAKKSGLGAELSKVMLKSGPGVVVSNCVAARAQNENTITPRVFFTQSLKTAKWKTLKDAKADDVPKVEKQLALPGGAAAAILKEATGEEPKQAIVNGVKLLRAGDLKAIVCDGLKALKAAQGIPADYVQVNVCPGGCLRGGGSPQSDDGDALAKRKKVLDAL
jgi:iron only hydrogenase large subunit-like protein